MKYALLVCCLFIGTIAAAQQKLIIHFVHTVQGQKAAPKTNYTTPNGDDYMLTHWKYYVSNIHLGSKASTNDIFLIDAFGKDSISITLPKGKYASLAFELGIDSQYQVSGAQAGDLDPLLGMFWTWNTGYIIYKLEGFANKKKFEYHLGGFKAGEKINVPIKLAFSKKLRLKQQPVHIYIPVELNNFWIALPNILTTQPVVSKAGPTAVQVAEKLPQLFHRKIKLP